MRGYGGATRRRGGEKEEEEEKEGQELPTSKLETPDERLPQSLNYYSSGLAIYVAIKKQTLKKSRWNSTYDSAAVPLVESRHTSSPPPSSKPVSGDASLRLRQSIELKLGHPQLREHLQMRLGRNVEAGREINVGFGLVFEFSPQKKQTVKIKKSTYLARL